MTPRATIRDVAAAAGVSVTTVSHVLNDTPGKRVHPDTRDRVRSAADTLGYVPNVLAQGLRTQRTGTIGLVGDEIATTPFAIRLIGGAEDAVKAHDSLLLVTTTGYEPAVEDREIRELLRRRVDGVLYAAMYHREVTVPPALHGVPTVLANAFSEDATVPSVVPDEAAGAWDATAVLLEAGHRRIAFLCNRDDIPASHLRFLGFRERAAAAGLILADLPVRFAESTAQGGYEAALPLLSAPDRPTGIFCFNDRMAMGVYRAARELGIEIPGDLSVVGYDNQEYVADALYPALTTVALPHYEMGVWAVEALFAQIDAPAEGAQALPPAQHASLRCPVVHRDSVASPPR